MGRVLVACEESQIVCTEFRKLGHEAYSCDILPCSGGHPEWHIQDDVRNHLGRGWDLMIAHPPCTYLCLSGLRWLNDEKRFPNRKEQQREAIEFVELLYNSAISRIAIENPIGIIPRLSILGRYSQIIQPYEYGDSASKKTCLWLKNLPLLHSTNIVNIEYHTTAKGRKFERWFWETSILPYKDRSKVRSRTFVGIAKAMAGQWGELLRRKRND